MSTSMDSAVLWNLGRRLGAVLGAASGERFRPKPRALAGLEPALDALGVKVSLEDLARANREDRATAIDAIRKGAGRLASLGWSAQWLRDYASLEENERPPLSEKAREVASRFILESAELEGRERRDVAEIRGWCDAIAAGYARPPYDLSELARLVDEVYAKEGDGAASADADEDSPVTFRSATADHVVMMAVLHHIVSTISGLRYGGASVFRGGVKQGIHAYDDESESHFIVGWNDAGVVGFAFHKYACEEERELEPDARDPMRWLRGLPPELEPLGNELSNQAGRFFTAGMWISRAGERHQDGVGGEDGSSHFKALTSAPREALFKKPGYWAQLRSITTDQAELARTLAKRSVGGGGEIEIEESEILLERPARHGDGHLFTLTEKALQRAVGELAKVGLSWGSAAQAAEPELAAARAVVERAIAEAMSPDERALFDAAKSNDPAMVKELVGRGVSTERGAVQNQFGALPIAPGMTPLFVAIRAGATEAALALIEAGAALEKAVGPLNPFTCAVQGRNIEVARRLLERGASAQGSPAMPPPVLLAALHGDLPMVELLLAAKAGLGNPAHYTVHVMERLRAQGYGAIVKVIERALQEHTSAD